MIEFQNISLGFDNRIIVKDFSAKIACGEHVALMGESGAGKSTLMGALMGLSSPLSGVIVVEGVEISSRNIQEVRRRIAWVPQEVQLPYEFVTETIAAPFELKVNQHLKFDKEKLYSLFDNLLLDRSIYHRRMNEISGGERQRLMLVLAVLLEKKIMLLDEPTSAIDPQNRIKLVEFLRSQSTTMLAVTHDTAFAASCDQLINLKKLKG